MSDRRIDGFAANLLRRHVARRPPPSHQRSPFGAGCRGRFVARLRQLRDAEVENLDPPVVGDEQVVRLYVAVDDPLVVRGGEPLRGLARVVDGFARRQRASLQPLRSDSPSSSSETM